MRGTFKYVYIENPLVGRHNDRRYQKGCIDEMRKMYLQRSG